MKLSALLTLLSIICEFGSRSCEDKSFNPIITQITGPVIHGEGPHWDSTNGALYFVDISGKTVYRYDANTKQITSAFVGKEVSPVVPTLANNGKFMIGRGLDLAIMTWDGSNATKVKIDVLDSVDKRYPTNRFNDGKADAVGRIWIGTMGEEVDNMVPPNRGTLYRMSNHSCKLEPVLSDVSVSNGLAWSLDNRIMYYIDTPTKKIDAFDYNILSAAISNRRTVFDFEEKNVRGIPDGMTIDEDGNLWIACFGGYKVINVNPTTGSILKTIDLPVEKVTSVTFGGDNFETLFVTTTRLGLSRGQLEKQPQAGAVFAVNNLGTRGMYNVPVIECANVDNSI